MTEDEAKTKICCGPPFVATMIVACSDGGSVTEPDRLGKCIGSACMGWRVTGSKFKDAGTGALSDRDLTGHGKWIDSGYCGLAGATK